MSVPRSIALGSLTVALIVAVDHWQPFAPDVDLTRLSLPILGDVRRTGADIRFEVGGPTDGFEFRFWVKGSGDWAVEQDWSRSATFEFAPHVRASYAFQVDVRREGEIEPAAMHWIGMTTVGPLADDEPLAKAIRVTPTLDNLGPTREIVLELTPGARSSITDLETRILADDTEIMPWQAWPRHPITLPELVDRELDCEVRLARSPQRVERHVLGRMGTVQNSDAPDVLRLIVAGRRSRAVPELAIPLLAERVWASCESFLVQSEQPASPPLASRAALLMQRMRTSGWRQESPSIAVSPTGQQLHFRAEPFVVQWGDDPVWVDLSLEHHDAVGIVLHSTRDLPHEARVAVLAGYFVFRAYDYGNDAPSRMRSLSEPLGQCATTTGLLSDLLRELGIDVRVMTLDTRGAAHALTWTRHGPGCELVIDTSEGTAFPWSPTLAGSEPVPPAIEFPGRRRLGLDLHTAFDPGVTILRSASRFEPVIPRELERSSLRVEYRPR